MLLLLLPLIILLRRIYSPFFSYWLVLLDRFYLCFSSRSGNRVIVFLESQLFIPHFSSSFLLRVCGRDGSRGSPYIQGKLERNSLART
jgi:hypothetical protein